MLNARGSFADCLSLESYADALALNLAWLEVRLLTALTLRTGQTV